MGFYRRWESAVCFQQLSLPSRTMEARLVHLSSCAAIRRQDSRDQEERKIAHPNLEGWREQQGASP